ncbi:MAG: P-loop NTPase [Bacteroidales bacterium]|nr:P-loop NTPase [Bacteroidales bacterium]
MFTIEKTIIPHVKHIVVVASGKGGVGKSTVSVLLATTLARKGYKVALVDADIYGPSVPKMFGMEDEQLMAHTVDGEELMIPMEKYGVKFNSVGFVVNSHQAVIWRGPLAANVLGQLFTKTEWGDIDYMIVDFPPGTGDIQLSALQQYKIDAAIVVTIPQILSVNDARKGADMFSEQKLNVPLLGIVENMSWFTPQQHPDEKYYIFGKDGGQMLASEFNTKLLAQIPLITEVGEAVEEGNNLLEKNNETINRIFDEMADYVVETLSNPAFGQHNGNVKIAVPTVNNRVDDHFGHCDHYTIFEVDDNKNIVNEEIMSAGVGCGCKSGIAFDLRQKGVSIMLAGNMGDGAREVLTSNNIRVIRGCSGDIHELIHNYLAGKIADNGVGCSAHECHSHQCH